MCTNVTNATPIAGSARGATGDWFAADRAVVSFDHPQEVGLLHALCLDLWGRHGERVAVELDAASARRLAETILATLDDDDIRPLLS